MNFNAKASITKIVSFFLIALCTLSACHHTDLFEKNTVIPNQKWSADFTANGSFEISDTTYNYDVFIVLRHTDAYKYNNIWLNVGLQQPGDSMILQKINVSLGNDAKGWLGTGMNDIREMREKIATLNLKKGQYKFSLSQIMRDNPLDHVMSAGLRIEKAQ
jgi:gliding motility-associated lipoprotein GldH